MATYSHFLGRGVTVQYRVGDILLSASGNFVGDCGRSIFLEQHLESKHGNRKYFRWEIPYPYIHRIEAAGEGQSLQTRSQAGAPSSEPVRRASAAAAGAESNSAAPLLPLPPNPDTA